VTVSLELPWLDVDKAFFIAVAQYAGDDTAVALDYRTSAFDPRVVASDIWTMPGPCRRRESPCKPVMRPGQTHDLRGTARGAADRTSSVLVHPTPSARCSPTGRPDKSSRPCSFGTEARTATARPGG
jgi:hypothetical protein